MKEGYAPPDQYISNGKLGRQIPNPGANGAAAPATGGSIVRVNGKDVSSLVVKTCLDTFHVLSDYIEHKDALVRMATESNEKVNKKYQDNYTAIVMEYQG